jgi:hypothetical protein
VNEAAVDRKADQREDIWDDTDNQVDNGKVKEDEPENNQERPVDENRRQGRSTAKSMIMAESMSSLFTSRTCIPERGFLGEGVDQTVHAVGLDSRSAGAGELCA